MEKGGGGDRGPKDQKTVKMEISFTKEIFNS